MGFANVIFAVSNDELKAYEQFSKKGVTVVGYDGFGMGCGRAAGINIAKKLGRICIMTDDRTKGLTYYGDDITEDQLKSMIGPADDNPLYFGDKPFITGVQPKGELNILTVINPLSAEPERPTFSECFIASKEDKALYLYCQALRLRRESELGETADEPLKLKLGDTSPDLQVHFDASNPAYPNTVRKFDGEKGEKMKCVTSSKLYRSLEDKPLDWKHLSTTGGFKNQWDAVKMQDSAMFLLLQEIVADMRKGVSSEVCEAFDKYIAPWFT